MASPWYPKPYGSLFASKPTLTDEDVAEPGLPEIDQRDGRIDGAATWRADRSATAVADLLILGNRPACTAAPPLIGSTLFER